MEDYSMNDCSDSVESTSGQVPGPSVHISFSLLQENGFQEQVSIFMTTIPFLHLHYELS